MYAWIWQHLPGSGRARMVIAVLIVAAVLAVLFLVVFPAADGMISRSDVAAAA